MKRKFFAAFLSLCMVMILVPMTALAAPENDGAGTPSTQAATELPGAVDGVITLNEDVTLGTDGVSIDTDISTIDLNGHTLTAQISVAGNLTIKDGSENGGGKITSTGNPTVLITHTGNLVLDAGTIETTGTEKGPGAIRNEGSLTINGGLVTGKYGIRSGAQTADGTLLNNNVSLTINGGTVHGDEYGIYTYGRGITNGDVTTVNNEQVTLTITGGRVECGNGGAAIGTNASSGKYAGYTFTMTGGEIDGSTTGTGLYLPAIGINNIFSGTITGDQAIRIASGELNITGGTITSTGSNTNDIIAGGTGGASGALVIGKAGMGYVGDLIVNVSGNATLKNETQGDHPTAVFVTDKTMNDSSYDDVAIEVNIEDISITGDIVRASDLTTPETNAKGSTTTLNISGVTVNGNVTNQSTNGNLLIDDSIVNGTVSNTSQDASVSVNNSHLRTTNGNNIIFAGNSTVGGNEQASTGVAMVKGKIYSNLADALNAVQDNGGTITLLKDATLDSANYTISKPVTIQGKYTITATPALGQRTKVFTIENGGKLMLDGVTLNITGTQNAEDDKKEGDGINVRYGAELVLNNATVTFTDMFSPLVFEATPGITTLGKLTMDNSAIVATGTRGNFSNGGEWNIKNGSAVNIKDCGTHGLSVEKLNVDASDITVDGAKWVGIYASKISLENGANINVMNCATDETIGATYKSKGAVQLKHVGEETPTLTIKDSTLILTGNGNGAKTNEQTIYIGKGDMETENAQINGTLALDESVTNRFVVTYVNNGKQITTELVESGEKITFPVLSDQGYNHFVGWTDGAKTYDVNDQVSISKDTTFTAVWSYTPPANPNYKITIGAMENGTVTANPTAAKAGATVTLTPVPDEGYALSTLTVTDRFGDAVRVTEQADGTYTFPMPNGQVTVTATFVQVEEPAPTEPFVDVNEGDWFYDAVVYAYQNELMDGVGGNRFAPNSETTRAQLVTILYRLEGEPAVSGDLPFTDVEAGIWYTDAILWAAQNNIVNGVNDTEFAPGDDLTRQQLVTILYRYAETKGYDVSASADLSGYPDADQVQDYAQPAMAWAVAENIIQGMEDGTLKPAGNASRAQIATILMRFCEDVAQ